MYSILPQPDACLFFDASKRADGDVTHRMRDRNSAGFGGVLELLVTPLVRNLIPAVVPQMLDDLPAAHG
jgi:hypothetical protein